MTVKVTFDEVANTITLDDMKLSPSVLKAIADPDKRLLWRFRREGGKIFAVPFSEKDVIWLDPDSEPKT